MAANWNWNWNNNLSACTHSARMILRSLQKHRRLAEWASELGNGIFQQRLNTARGLERMPPQVEPTTSSLNHFEPHFESSHVGPSGRPDRAREAQEGKRSTYARTWHRVGQCNHWLQSRHHLEANDRSLLKIDKVRRGSRGNQSFSICQDHARDDDDDEDDDDSGNGLVSNS